MRSILVGLVVAFITVPAQQSYRDEIVQHRTAREVELKADDGWLTVTGLFWLKPGLPVRVEAGELAYRSLKVKGVTAGRKPGRAVQLSTVRESHAGPLTLQLVQQPHDIVGGQLDEDGSDFRMKIVAQLRFDILHRRNETLFLAG
jgi:hypothetical protein